MLDTGIHPCPSSLGRSYVSVVGSRASAPQEFISIQTSKVLEGWGRLLTYGPGTRTEIFVRRVDPEGWALSPAKQVSITTVSLPAQGYYGALAWALPALGPPEMASAFDRQGLGLCAGHWPVLWPRPEVTLQTTASPV